MDNRYTIINDLVVQACNRLRKMGIEVSAKEVEGIVQSLYSKNESIDQVKCDIAKVEREKATRHEVEGIISSGLDVARNLQNLSLEHKGITLHNQDIDLMMIATSSSFEELELALSRITNISAPGILENEGFIEYRQRVFDSYLEGLSPLNDFIRNNKLDLIRKLEHLSTSGTVSAEEMAIVNRIIRENASNGHAAMVCALTDTLGKDRVHDILSTLRDFTPIEKPGIKETSIEHYQEKYNQVKYFYDSITIDEEAKYGKVILQDGTFEDKHLRKALDFARSNGKTMRINTLMFYMDCPEDIYNLDEGLEASDIAREKLRFYVDEATKLFAEYPDVVRSVDVFNELLNRHAMPGDVPYMLRGDIPQVRGADGKVDDNIKAGWMKHLTVEDICEVLAVARGNLPNVDFMYNDDHLTDPSKLPATIELIKRIQDYSRGLGVKLIDSIGTQMHIDNDVTKEEIRNMFLALSELGLPIEITEFDLAMTSGMEGLTPEQIELVRQKKINEVYEVIEELRDTCNIRGLTIWSVTDSQNFRVTLSNEQLIPAGKEPITTLHGGMFTEGMIPKSAEMAKLVRKQNFNYHGHTSRCGHASPLEDSLYITAARNMGIERVGFSDHVPLSLLENWQQGQKMHISEVDDYISSVRNLQRENPDMVIRCGFEAEYEPLKVGHLCELRNSCDYMILGQHYVQRGMGIVDKNDNPDYPLIYAQAVCEAMGTGIYDILAHPDYFMLVRDKCSSAERRALFMENAKKASYMICAKAKEMGIPVELNVRGAEEYARGADGEFAYPHSVFWDAAAEVGNTVIYGVDAHHPSHMMEIDSSRELVESGIDTSKLQFAAADYDPVLAREENLALQEAYEETESKAVTQETAMVQMLLSSVEIEEGQDVRAALSGRLGAFGEKFDADTGSRLRKVDEKIAEIEESTEYSDDVKARLKAKYELRKERIVETAHAKQEALDRARESLAEAHEMGCETKEEYVQVVGLLTESKTESSPMKMANASSELDAFKESKEHEKDVTTGDTPKTYVYTNPTNNTSSDSSDGGFTSSYNLIVAIGMLILFGIILGFLIK